MTRPKLVEWNTWVHRPATGTSCYRSIFISVCDKLQQLGWQPQKQESLQVPVPAGFFALAQYDPKLDRTQGFHFCHMERMFISLMSDTIIYLTKNLWICSTPWVTFAFWSFSMFCRCSWKLKAGVVHQMLGPPQVSWYGRKEDQNDEINGEFTCLSSRWHMLPILENQTLSSHPLCYWFLNLW